MAKLFCYDAFFCNCEIDSDFSVGKKMLGNLLIIEVAVNFEKKKIVGY